MDPRRLPPVCWPAPPAAAGGWLEGPGPAPPPTADSMAPRVPPMPRARHGLFGIPRRRARPGCPPVGQSPGGGGGAVSVPPSFRGAVGRPRGAGGGGSPYLGPPPCLPRGGTKAGLLGVAQSMEGVAPVLHRLASACRRPDAVRGVPLRAGARLLACRNYCGSGRAADWGARGVRAQWCPFPGAAAISGGGLGGFLGPAWGLPGPCPLGSASGCPWAGKEGPYQDRPLLYPFHHFLSLPWSCFSPGSA